MIASKTSSSLPSGPMTISLIAGRARRIKSSAVKPPEEDCRSTTRYSSAGRSSSSSILPTTGCKIARPWKLGCSKMLASPARRIGSSEIRPIKTGSGLRIENDIRLPLLDGRRVMHGKAAQQAQKMLLRPPFPFVRSATSTGFSDPAPLQLGKHNPLLFLVFSLAVGIAHLARFIGAEEQNLAQPFVGVNLGR